MYITVGAGPDKADNGSHYQTPQGTIHYDYGDWISGGQDDHRMFRTLTLLDASQQPTGEQFHYVYDAFGRLTSATFAMTPITGQTGYSAAYPAATRGRAFYDLDAGGRVKSVEYYWDTWNANSSSYGSQPILKNSCTYDPYKVLKTTSSFWSGGGQGNWNANPDRTEQYGYDANLDYLTSVDYGDGLANPQQTWTYDAAGNRATDSVQGNGWSYDNLNRVTASPGYTYDSDLAGNRLHRYVSGNAETTYGWDEINRMTSLSNSSGNWTYAYRADGMRVTKTDGTNLTRFHYDGQMGMQDVDVSGATTTYTNYAIGCRGIDRIEKGGAVSYPMFDSHGNAVATLAAANGQYSISSQRAYGAWGDIRQGSSIGNPTGKYCANIGHKSDDESGLTYMRARYYDASSARFISLDPGRDGSNWYAHCYNDPVNKIDSDGKEAMNIYLQTFLIGMIAGFSFSLGEACVDNEFNLSVAGLAALKAAALSTLLLTASKMYGSEGLGSRIPLRAGYAAGFGSVAVVGLMAGVLLEFGLRAGQVMYELFEQEFDGMDPKNFGDFPTSDRYA